MTENDRILQKALLRFKIISAYLAENPPRGQRRAMLEHLSNKTWMLENGEIVAAKPDTIRYWIRLYRNGGFEALKDKPRSDKGCRAIPKEIIETACGLKQRGARTHHRSHYRHYGEHAACAAGPFAALDIASGASSQRIVPKKVKTA